MFHRNPRPTALDCQRAEAIKPFRSSTNAARSLVGAYGCCAGRAPHRTGRKTEAIRPIGRRHKGYHARRLRGAKEESAGTLDIGIARPRHRCDPPAAGIVISRKAGHLSRNGLAARKSANERSRCAPVSPAGLTWGHLDVRRNVLAARTRVGRDRGQGCGRDGESKRAIQQMSGIEADEHEELNLRIRAGVAAPAHGAPSRVSDQ